MNDKQALNYINKLVGNKTKYQSLDSVNFNLLAVCYSLQENFIETFYDRFHSSILFGTQTLSKKFLERHKNDIQIQSIINNRNLKAEYIIDIFLELKVNGNNHLLSTCKLENIFKSHKLTINQINLIYPFVNNKTILYCTQKFDERFLLEHEEDKFYWKCIQPKNLNVSDIFIEDFIHYVPFDDMIKSNTLPFRYIKNHLSSLLTYKQSMFLENTKLPLTQLMQLKPLLSDYHFLRLFNNSINYYKNNPTLSKLTFANLLLDIPKNKIVRIKDLNRLLR